MRPCSVDGCSVCGARGAVCAQNVGGMGQCSPLLRPLSHYCCCRCCWGCPVALEAAEAELGVPRGTQAWPMQPVLRRALLLLLLLLLLLARKHAIGVHDDSLYQPTANLCKVVPRSFCWGGRVAQKFAEFLQTFAIDHSVVNATGPFFQTFEPTAVYLVRRKDSLQPAALACKHTVAFLRQLVHQQQLRTCHSLLLHRIRAAAGICPSHHAGRLPTHSCKIAYCTLHPLPCPAYSHSTQAGVLPH